MSNDDPFDLSRFAPSPAMVGTAKPKRERRRDEGFVKTPWVHIKALAPHTTDKAWPVLMHILYEAWRNKGGPIKLPNGMLKRLGVSRDSKHLALRKLERIGVISVEWRDRKSPIITLRQ